MWDVCGGSHERALRSNVHAYRLLDTRNRFRVDGHLPSRSESTPKREEMDKAAVEAYLETHQINAALQESINAAVKAQSPDPKAHMGATLLSLSKHA
jgi:hypothetical protein